MITQVNNHNGDYSSHGVMCVDHIEVFQETETDYVVYVLDNKKRVVKCLSMDTFVDGDIVDAVREIALSFNCRIDWFTDLEVNWIVTQNIN